MSFANAGRVALQGARDIIDPKGAEQRKKDAEERKVRDNTRRMDLRWLMGDTRGRRIVSDLLARGHLLAPTSQDNARLTHMAEGKRELVLAIFFDLLASCPTETLALFKEHPTIQRIIDADKA